MDIPRSVFAPEVVDFLHQKTADPQAEQQRQHQYHDQCTERGMAQAMVVLAAEQRTQVPLQPRRGWPEVAPACCGCADKAPNRADQHNRHGVVAQPAMPTIAFFGKEVATDKGQH
ncbi:hypothetical protein D3C72_1984100 [compost metagenome]